MAEEELKATARALSSWLRHIKRELEKFIEELDTIGKNT